MPSEEKTTEQYGLETMDSDMDKDPITYIDEDSELVFSQGLPPKVENSNSFCRKRSTSIILALSICIVFTVAVVAFGLSVLTLNNMRCGGCTTYTETTAQQKQEEANLIIKFNNLTSRVLQLEMLMKEANTKQDDMDDRLKQSNDAIAELNSSHIPILEDKFDLLDGKLKANVTTLKNELNKTASNVSLLSDLVFQAQTDFKSNVSSFATKLNILPKLVTDLNSTHATQKETDLMVHNLTVHVMELEMLVNIKLDEIQDMLVLSNDAIVELNSSQIPILKHKFHLLDDKLKAHVTTLMNELYETATNVSLLSASHTQLAVQVAELDTTMNETDSLISQVAELQDYVYSIERHTSSEQAIQETNLNAAVTRLDSFNETIMACCGLYV